MLTLLTTWLRAEAATLARAARSWPLYALLGLGALLWTAAWQIKTPVSIDLGGPDDDAFVADQHTGELNPPSSFYAKEVVTDASGLRRTYRWSQGQSRLIVPGLGNTNIDVTLRLAGARPPATGLPPPVVTMTVRGQVFPLQTTGDLQDYVKFVGRGPWAADNLVITLDSPTFTPPGDARALGVLVDSVTITPLGDNGQPTGLRPWTIPSLGHLAFWLATLAVLYGTLFRLGGPGLATGGAGLGMLLLAAGIVGARPWVGFLAPQAPILAAWGYALSVLGLPLAAWG